MAQCYERLKLQACDKSSGCCEDDLPADRYPACEPGSNDLLAWWCEGCYPVVLAACCWVDGGNFGEGKGYCYGANEGDDAVGVDVVRSVMLRSEERLTSCRRDTVLLRLLELLLRRCRELPLR